MNAPQDRPLVTFALFAYNQEHYIREAVEGAFAQTYEPLEIILSDDCSSDRTFEIMQEMAAAYKGPHRILLRRSESNKGVAAHFNNVVGSSKGTFIVVAAGDDISLANRVSHCAEHFRMQADLTFIETPTNEISDKGEFIKEYYAHAHQTKITLDMLIQRTSTGLVGASRAYQAELFRKFPPLFDDCPTEDSTTILRGLIVGNGLYSSTITVNRRVHDASISHKSNIHKVSVDSIERQFYRDIEYAVLAGYIETRKADKLTKSLRDHMSRRRLASIEANRLGIAAMIRYSVKDGLSLRTILTLFRLLLKRTRHDR
jgi:glycosyltransferase involved in cell wall biosynthesis